MCPVSLFQSAYSPNLHLMMLYSKLNLGHLTVAKFLVFSQIVLEFCFCDYCRQSLNNLHSTYFLYTKENLSKFKYKDHSYFDMNRNPLLLIDYLRNKNFYSIYHIDLNRLYAFLKVPSNTLLVLSHRLPMETPRNIDIVYLCLNWFSPSQTTA